VPSSFREYGLPAVSDTEIEAIAERLRKGEFLDDHWRRRLFREPKEAELAYAGKQRSSVILAETMPVPLQQLKCFGSANESRWANLLVFGDNLQVLKTLLEMKERGELLNADGTPGVRICYIDPPFATKREFRGSKNQPAYRDKVERAEFIEFLRKRLIFIHELLADDGVLYLHLDTNKVHYMKVLLDEIFGPHNFRTEIIWKRSSAHSDTKQGRRQHGRIHDTILFYAKGNQWVWNPMFLPYAADYDAQEYRHIASDGRRYKQTDLTAAKPGGDTSYEWRVKRPEDTIAWETDLDDEWRRPKEGWDYKGVKPYQGRYWAYSKSLLIEFDRSGLLHYRRTGMPRLMQFADEMEGVSLQDLWTDIVPVSAGSAEREAFPTQKPRALLERVIETSSNEGDLVLDCFAGSGTTAVVSERLNRRWIAIDCGKLAIYTAQRRLLGLDEGNGKAAALQSLMPFKLCSAGLYDNALLEKLPFQEYETFVLQLFGCRSGPHELGGVPMVGTRKGAPVHIFPFNKTDAVMGRGYIMSLHERIKSKVSGEVYIIAPVSACDPTLFEDLVTLDENTYFVLRVPYSVIEALHGRGFELLSQPGSLDELNDAMDSFGFDFVEVPEAKIAYARAKTELRVEVKEFRRGGLDPDDFAELEDAGRSDLAMVMADTDYDSDVFRLREHRFGDELAKDDWMFQLDLTHAGGQLALIYMDTHGNERREVLELRNLRKKNTHRRTTARASASDGGKSARTTTRSATTGMAAKKTTKAAPIPGRRTKRKT
jgi:DNA modification methylase